MTKYTDHTASQCAACAASQRCGDLQLVSNLVAQFNIPKTHKDFSRGECIYAEGDEFSGIYCLQEGLIALRKYGADGSAAVVRMVQPGEIFGYRSFLIGESHNTTAEALAPTKVCFIRRDTLQRSVDQSPKVQQELIKQMGRDMDGIEHLFLLTVTKSVPSRFAHLLLGMASHIDPNADNVTFKLPIHKKDVANIIGVAVESLSRVISRMRDQGIIDEKSGVFTIKNRQALLNLIEEGSSF